MGRLFDGTLGLSDAHLAILGRWVGLALAATFLALVFGLPTAWFIATRSPASRAFWLFLITIPFWTSLLVRNTAIQKMIPADGVTNRFLLWMGAIDAPVQMLFTNFAVLPVDAALERFDFRLAEASYDLYASRPYCLRRVILPMVRPGVIAGSILVFVPAPGAYVTPRLMGGGRAMMLGNLIDLQLGQGRNWPLGAALSVALTVMVLLALVWYTRVTSAGGRRNV